LKVGFGSTFIVIQNGTPNRIILQTSFVSLEKETRMNLRRCCRWLAVFSIAVAALAGRLPGQAAPSAIPAAQGGFVPDDDAANAANATAGAPSIAFGKLAANDPLRPWLAFAEGSQIKVAEFDSNAQAWLPRGAALNFPSGGAAAHPSLDFAETAHQTPWAAFVQTIGDKQQILAARFSAGVWTLAGDVRANSVPSLNRDITQNADNPALKASGTPTSTSTLPWAAWDEATSGARRVFVSRPKAGGAPESFSWQPVGAAIGFDTQRDSSAPDLAFAGASGANAWVAWQEQGGGQAGKVFAARTPADGASGWNVVGNQASCASETTCALNLDPGHRSAASPHGIIGRSAWAGRDYDLVRSRRRLG
jgi:hypothetical protein